MLHDLQIYSTPHYQWLHFSDSLHEAEIIWLADALSTLSFNDLATLTAGLGFSEGEVYQRMQHVPQKLLVVELLLEFSKRTPYHVKRRLGQVLLNNGHWKEGLRMYPSG